MNKEKILFILHYSPPIHGASKVGDSILKSDLLKQNFNTKYIKIESSKNIKSIGKFQFNKIIDTIILFNNILSKLLFFKPQKIYYTVSPNGFAFYRDFLISMPIKLFAKVTRCELFYHYHALGLADFTSKSNLKKKLVNFFLNNINIILISSKIKSELTNLTNYKRVFYLENGVEDPLESEEFLKILKERETNKNCNILFLSNIIKTKGYDTVLELAKDLKTKGYKDFKFHFAGSWGSDKDKLYFNNFITKNELEAEVQYHGLVTGKNKKNIFTLANMFIFPTRYSKEVFPLSVLEALSYGLPVLAFDKGAITDILNDDIGVISNKDVIFNDFIKMKNTHVNKEVSLVCRKNFEQKYSMNIFEKKLLATLKLKDEC